MLNRRNFLGTAAAGLAAGYGLQGQAQDKVELTEICVFTKPLQSLSFDDLAEQVAKLGFDGLEAPIRLGGHMEPEVVPDKLPIMVEALRKRGLKISIMTSGINDPDRVLTEVILQTAAKLGIRRYRMGYLKYDPNIPVAKQLAEWRPQLRDLAAMNRDLGLSLIHI